MRFLFIAVFTCITADLYSQPDQKLAVNRETISVDYEDTSVREIITAVGQQYGLKTVWPEELTGNSSLKAHDVTWRQVYHLLLAPLGYDFIEREDRVDILTSEKIDRLPEEHQSVELFFQRSGEMAEFIKKTFPGKVGVEISGNTLIIAAHPRFIQQMIHLIAETDTPDFRLNRFPREPHFPVRVPTLLVSEGPVREMALRNPNMVINQVFLFHWIDCAKVKPVLEREYPNVVKIIIDHRSNALIVSADELTCLKISALAEYLDDKKWYQLLEPDPEHRVQAPLK